MNDPLAVSVTGDYAEDVDGNEYLIVNIKFTGEYGIPIPWKPEYKDNLAPIMDKACDFAMQECQAMIGNLTNKEPEIIRIN